ncbi:MAG: hypothetical protein ABI208_09175 [Ginsengibacter sp.]|jgi:hypothetical protein
MPILGNHSSLKRLRNRYRLVLINEDTFQEIIAFKLTRWSVYVMLSAIFIILVGLTITLVAFSPLKYYIPGYGDTGKAKDYEQLQFRADSIEQVLIVKQKYYDGLEMVLKGSVTPLDTAVLNINMPQKEIIINKKENRKRKKR